MPCRFATPGISRTRCWHCPRGKPAPPVAGLQADGIRAMLLALRTTVPPLPEFHRIGQQVYTICWSCLFQLMMPVHCRPAAPAARAGSRPSPHDGQTVRQQLPTSTLPAPAPSPASTLDRSVCRDQGKQCWPLVQMSPMFPAGIAHLARQPVLQHLLNPMIALRGGASHAMVASNSTSCGWRAPSRCLFSARVRTLVSVMSPPRRSARHLAVAVVKVAAL